MYICRLCHNLTVGNINEISIYLSIFLCIAFPSTIFHPLFATGAVVGASGRVVSWGAGLLGRGSVVASVEVTARGCGGYLIIRASSIS
jgi:hypothetical protein